VALLSEDFKPTPMIFMRDLPSNNTAVRSEIRQRSSMKPRLLTLVAGIAAALLCLLSFFASAQLKQNTMTLNAGVVTEKLKESKEFYTALFDMQVVFENDFYLLLKTRAGHDQISFLKPNHESQQRLFQPPFGGKGAYLTIEVENVDAYYERFRKRGIPIVFAVRQEPWGDKHFAIEDPNGIGIDIVTYTAPTN
jgi:catechol 2,3-dioxygenase-like lactoylglutathione lyase family enzyme